MKPRHWVTLACVALAGVILYLKTTHQDPASLGKSSLQPPWLWDGAFWLLLLFGLIAVLRRPRRRH